MNKMMAHWTVFCMIAGSAVGLCLGAEPRPTPQPASKPFAPRAADRRLDLRRILQGGAKGTRWQGSRSQERRQTPNTTGTGLKKLDQWLGDGKWDVIHFNWGLWDMYGWQYAKEDRSPAVYQERLEAIVSRLKKTGRSPDLGHHHARLPRTRGHDAQAVQDGTPDHTRHRADSTSTRPCV